MRRYSMNLKKDIENLSDVDKNSLVLEGFHELRRSLDNLSTNYLNDEFIQKRVKEIHEAAEKMKLYGIRR